MFVIGLIIHIFFLLSVFDIYFKSPVVKDVAHYQPHHEALADRLVLFVVDGLRAESFLNYTTMPYLRSIANSHGRWGISQTRVPTESRPGHIAVISGFYEDPSAVAKGWKDNPVDFDSVFNQTKYTWCWGAYDIINIFTKGNIDDHIFPKTFDPYDDTFSSDKNTTHLDLWVFENVRNFFHDAKSNRHLTDKLKRNKISFFLHLLGTDTSGHTDRPRTERFHTTLKFVDEGIREIEKVIRDFYDDDGKTTFLMTSDHGMTDWGSHGSGDNHETETPYVLWGAGVQKAEGTQIDLSTSGMSLDRRFDVEQADLTPLMATILSIPVPVNNVGKLLPTILNMTLANKAKALLSNAKQIASQYAKKQSDIEANIISTFYYPFMALTKERFKEIFDSAEKIIEQEEYEKVIVLCEKVIPLSLSGLHYYHNYYQRPLLILVTLSFIGWIMCLLRLLAEQNLEDAEKKILSDYKKSNFRLDMLFSVLLFTVFCFVFVQSLPLAYYVYFLKPIGLWWYALSNTKIWREIFQQVRKRGLGTAIIEVFCYSLGSFALGLSFTYRWMLSIPLFGMGLWPFFSKRRSHLPGIYRLSWTATCAVLSLFTFMPVVGKEVFIELVILAGLLQFLPLIILLDICNILKDIQKLLPLYRTKSEYKREFILFTIHLMLRIISLHNIYVQSKRFEQGTPVSSTHQVVAWVIAVLSIVLPLLHSTRLICRLFAISTSILNFYLLLSVCHEGIFMVTLMYNMGIWIYIEFQLVGQNSSEKQFTELMFGQSEETKTPKIITNIERNISSEDFRRAFFFMSYIITAFFGTGNIASVNSFEVRWVTCFLTSYKPFVITGLILLKTLAPFLIVACSFKAVQLLAKAPMGYLNIIVLIYSNLMGIQLLYNVKNTGSWMEIGTSISQYVIVQVITIFIVLMNNIAKYLTEISIRPIKRQKKYV